MRWTLAWQPRTPNRYQPFATATEAATATATEPTAAAGLTHTKTDLAELTGNAEENDWIAATALRTHGRVHADLDTHSHSAEQWAGMGAAETRRTHPPTCTWRPRTWHVVCHGSPHHLASKASGEFFAKSATRRAGESTHCGCLRPHGLPASLA